MQIPLSIIGIDVGSVTVALTVIDPAGDLIHSAYLAHQGQVDDTLTALLSDVPPAAGHVVAATSSTPAHIQAHTRVDSRIAVIQAAKHHYPAVRAIVLVGGEKFGLLRFDEQGRYLGYKTNTSCAAGTGSFLDQQAQRLNMVGISEFARCAARHQGPRLKIASRCAVFAKTDLIHAQQEGYDLAAICDGLCYGLAENIYDALFARRNRCRGNHYVRRCGRKPGRCAPLVDVDQCPRSRPMSNAHPVRCIGSGFDSERAIADDASPTDYRP